MDVRDLRGAAALVASAGSGIGRELALACARALARTPIARRSLQRTSNSEH